MVLLHSVHFRSRVSFHDVVVFILFTPLCWTPHKMNSYNSAITMQLHIMHDSRHAIFGSIDR